jgi:DNA-binding transcriptional LysR family regulator
MQRLHPGIALELVEGDIASLTQQVERGELDAALQYDTGLARPRMELLPVAALPPYVLLPQRHALAARTSVGLAEVARYPLVLINLPHSREYFLSLFREAGVTPLVAHEFASIEMLRSMVANGHGLSVLTTRPVVDRAHDGQRLACRRIRGRVAPQGVVLAVPAGNASPLIAPFLKVARAVIAP